MKPVPTSHGSVSSTLSIGAFHLTEAAYDPVSKVPEHEHLRAGWTLTLSGSYVETFGHQNVVLPAGAVVAKPASARHSNQYGSAGARCFLIGVDQARLSDSEGIGSALDRVAVHAEGPISSIMRRMHAEFVSRESACCLLLEGLALELAAFEVRISRSLHKVPTGWLARVRDRLHASLVRPPSFSTLAFDAGVHPVHLSRAFRQAYGATPGEYLRKIRIEYSRQLLANSARPIAQVAALAGFYDQSHFARVFRALTGVTPARYRSLYRCQLESSERTADAHSLQDSRRDWP
jgi:AraC family transcriptional regulator